MAIAPIQHRSASVASPDVLAYTSNVGGTGSALTANVWWQSASATMAVSDSRNGSWTALGSPKVGVNGLAGFSFQQFVMLAPGAGATTVTATASSGTPAMGLNIHEFGGFTGTPTVTGTPAYATHADGVGSTGRVTGTVTSSVAAAVFIVGVFPADAMVASASPINSPFTDQSGNGGDASWGSGGYGYEVFATTQTNISCTYDLVAGNLSDITGLFAIGDVPGGSTPPFRPVVSRLQAVNTAASW